MVRFSASKFKNAECRLRREDVVTGVRIGELCQNQPVACGMDKIVFTGEGSALGVLDVGEAGLVQTPDKLQGHSVFVRSLQFNPFSSECLVTCAGDGVIKLWNVNELSCTATIPSTDQVNQVTFHPVASSLVLAAEGSATSIYDISTQQQVLKLGEVPGTTVSWSYDGRLACVADKGGVVWVVDPRVGGRDTVTSTATLMDQHKDIQHTWLGVDKLLLAGYKNKERVFKTVSISDLSSDISSLSHGRGSGNPFALWDEDTRMAFLYAKGDHGFTYAEVGEGGVLKENWKERVGDPIKGVALAPKLILDVMKGEVARLMILHSTSVRPAPCIVPRKSYHDFHSDLFPETRGSLPGVDAEGWLNGNSGYRELVSLDPAVASAAARSTDPVAATATEEKKEEKVVAPPSPENERHRAILTNLTQGQSVYRNVEGVLSHKKEHFHGLKNVQSVLPQEGNGFQAGSRYASHLMTGSGGRVGIVDLSAPGQNQTPQVEIVTGGSPLVMAWEPFSGTTLAVGSDAAEVKLWRIEGEGGECERVIAHRSRVTFLSYHPGIRGVLLSGDASGHFLVTDTNTGTTLASRDVDDCVAVSWDVLSGYTVYLVQRNGDVQSWAVLSDQGDSGPVVSTGTELRNARVVCTRDYLVISSLGAGNARSLTTLSLRPQLSLVHAAYQLGSGTALYTPFPDLDRNLVYLAAKGEATILPFEVCGTGPPLPLASFSSPPVQSALSPLARTSCDVMAVEVARFWKLTKDCIQLLVFSVPRLRKQYFQDDLYPDSFDLSVPVVEEWGAEYRVGTVPLCPAGVKPSSSVEVVKTSSQHTKIQQEHTKFKSLEAQRDQLFNSFAEQVQRDAGPLPQDLMEGCDDDEWSD